MHNEDWDDLRFVLSVVQAGTVSAAARALNVNHATVLRRVSAFEAAFDVRVFNRSRQGYQLRTDALKVLVALREVEAAIAGVRIAASGGGSAIQGDVRITSTDSLCLSVLPGLFAEIESAAPGLKLSMLSSNEHTDLGRMGADIAVTPSVQLRDGLVGEAAGSMAFHAYGAPGRSAGGWLRLMGGLAGSVAGQWMQAHVDSDRLGMGSDSFPALRELAAAGFGRVILPGFLGDADIRLQRLPDGPRGLAATIWVASHADVADVPRFLETRRILVNGLRRALPLRDG